MNTLAFIGSSYLFHRLSVNSTDASMSTLIAIPIAVSMEAIVIPCSLNSVQMFSANEVLLFNTLAIIS